ncbi:putative AAA domain (Cdc48 subfamily) containing protein [Lyophyllum shimeji]|uniref:AAA domain (Cdc48 subfamily) containing protein n=1 Tax=Lyophyllum shimeji TaxID=47721 RepID=A0A9P3PD30_LYOSH|nr:putative AAA domain (Cdc48 subfamily) containing protein [Lyophyllum shimeji]
MFGGGSSKASEQTFHFPQNLFPTQPTVPTIHLPPMAAGLRRSGRLSRGSDSAGPSGSEYQESDKSMEAPNGIGHDDDEPEPEPPVEYVKSSRGRTIVKKRYVESEDDGMPDLFADDQQPTSKRSSRHSHDADEDDDDVGPRRYQMRPRTRRSSFIATDDDEDVKPAHNTRFATRRSTRTKNPATAQVSTTSTGKPAKDVQSDRARRLARRSAARTTHEEDDYVHQTSSGASADADGSIDEAPHASSDLELEPPEPEPEPEEDGEADGRPYALRQRQRINYAIPPPLEDMRKPPPKPASGGRLGGRSGYHGGHGRGKKGLGWSASGAELGRWMGMGGDDSDSDHAPTRTPRKQFGGAGFGAMAGAASGGGMFNGDLAAVGTPSNMGRVSGTAALADADPLGVNVNVTFDEVGGLDEHIHSLKEMTLLPLLYPEVFQKFNVTPPRGVLFHGPPGTGKTLLARALATSCRSDGRSISFFMRKGADCLSKWVGEAERQLRLLFEEARASQPSIIFFDEIDGLAPVRSAKQDQIHASIVSTLLALMDGMDGRGQVVVIGATNRPDAVDPALRRPGRFDREFYFGLPGLDARERILGIMTRGWVGWGEEVKEVEGDVVKTRWNASEKLKGLAKLTKGYGGADLRALCTEAALNAVQRRYPQIYKSNERLLLKPESIEVGLRDFMISIKKLVPSSARSTSSAATPLPPQFRPLLDDALERIKAVIGRVLPMEKKLTALEEAMYEDDTGEEGALEREMLMQSMQTLRVYRPRVIVHGPVGMGQSYIGAAALHHLEGYHIQTLELGTLMSDSTRTIEAAIVQLFVEAKRHQPSVIYIPSLLGWCAAVSETSRSTVRAMLDTLAPTDPILLLVVVDGNFAELPSDVKAWFGPTKDNRIELIPPTSSQREEFFASLVADIKRPPNQFADGVKRKLRVLEELPLAPPLEPRQPTAAELAVQTENDQRVITLLKYRLGPILTELKRKFKRFTKRATDEYNFEEEIMVPVEVPAAPVAAVTAVQEEQPPLNGVIDTTRGEPQAQAGVALEQAVSNGVVNGIVHQHQEQQLEQQQQTAVIQLPQLFDIDLEKMHMELFKDRYLTPQDFLDDIGKMVHNANARAHEDLDRLYKAQAMFTAAEVSIQEFDPQFRLECERMAVRERKRREEHRKEKGKEKEREKGKTSDDNLNGVANGTRRSARTTGQQPEIAITDPVQLERRLKRQRSAEATTDSHASEEEGGENRDAKRSRVAGAHEDHDPLNIVSPMAVVQPRVHFAPELEPMSHPNLQGTDMVVDAPPEVPRRIGGFDPSLLNPMSPDVEQNLFHAGPSTLLDEPKAPSPPAPVLPADPSNPFLSSAPLPATTLVSSPPRTPSAQRSRTITNSLEPLQQKPPSPIPMVIERTPTPLPDFYVDDKLVAELQRRLRDETDALTIEELEQLRATCLGCVWRHRMEWDRDALVKELLDLVNEFIAEVSVSQ